MKKKQSLMSMGNRAEREWSGLAASSLLMVMCGCSRSPDFNILGSYFPSWIFCVTGGIILSALARLLFLRLHIEHQLRPLPLVYTCLALFFACTSWLLFFN
jgi:hypothetical protein